MKFGLGLSAVLLGVSWVQPNHFPPWLSFHSEVLAFLSVAVCISTVIHGYWPRGAGKIKLGMPESTLLVLFLMALMQYAAGTITYGGDVAVLLLYVFGTVFAVVSGRTLADHRLALEVLAWTVLMAGLTSLGIAVFQATLPFDDFPLINLVPGWRRPGANMGQANHFGTLMLWAVASAIFLHLRRKISSTIGAVVAAILLAGAALSESRTAMIGVGLLAVWIVRVPRYWKRANQIAIAVAAFVFTIIFFYAWPPLLEGLQGGTFAGSMAGANTINTQGGARYIVWQQLLHTVGMHPIFGWGYGGVSKAVAAVADQYAETYPFTYAHSLVLDLLVWFGIPGAVGLIAVACYWVWSRFRTLRNESEWYASALLLTLGLHSSLEFPFAYAYFLFPAGFLIGILDSGNTGATQYRLPQKWLVGSVLMWLVLGGEVLREYPLAEEDYRVARAEALRVGRTPSEYSQPSLKVLNQLDELNRAIRVVPSPTLGDQELDLLRNASLRFPSIAVQRRYALALAFHGDRAEAQRQLKVIRAMYGKPIYAAILAQWEQLADEKYPEIRAIIQP